MVAITDVQKIGEVERDLAGTGNVREVPYVKIEGLPGASGGAARSADEIRAELSDQLFDLTVEVLFNNGLPMSGRAIVYGVLLDHLSEKFLERRTLGQVDEFRIRVVQDALHRVRPVFDRRELLTAILRDPPVGESPS